MCFNHDDASPVPKQGLLRMYLNSLFWQCQQETQTWVPAL